MTLPRSLRSPRPALHGLACTVVVAGSLSSLAQAADPGTLPPCPSPPAAQRPATNTVRLVTGAPYSALGTSETVTRLPDGNRIVRQNSVRMWRDSDGRTRSEYSLSMIGGPLPLDVNTTVTVIDDPATRTRYMLQSSNKVAVAVPISPCRDVDGTVSATVSQDLRPLSLGEREVDGEKVSGSRIVSTIPAGAIGNDQPITMSAEQWYGQDLKVVVEATYVDPRTGETRYKLRDIKRQEPDAKLFEVPREYSQKPANAGTGTVSGGGFNRRP